VARPFEETLPLTGNPTTRSNLALAALLALGAAAVQLWLVRGLQQLPSPLYGGDYSYQMGCIRSILASGNPMASCSCVGAQPGYLPFYGTLVALVVRITGLDVVRVMLGMSAFNHAAAVLAVWFVISRRFGRSAGLAMAALWAVLYVPPVIKYTEFTAQVLVPFYFDALIGFVESPRPRRALYLGLTLAVLGYAHSVAFVGGVAIAALCSIAALVIRDRAQGWSAAFATRGRGLAIVALGAAPALGYWWRPIFVLHGRTSAHYAEWNGGVLMRTFDDRLSYAAHTLGWMVSFEDPARAVLNVLFFAGLFAFVLARDPRRHGAAMLVAAVTFAWMFHYFVTMPILGTHFVPEYVRSMLWAFAILLVAAIPVAFLFDRLRSPRARLAAEALVVLAAFATLGVRANGLAADDAMVNARRPLPPHYAALQAWVLAHTKPDDVVLSSNELSFAWSALTGRKTLVTRRAQNDAFLDMDVRNRDAALILYGHDEALRRDRLKKWGVRYVLWTFDWIPSEFRGDAAGNVLSVDPMLYFPSADADSEMSRAGIATLAVHGWVDPAMRFPEIPQFDYKVIGPANYERIDHPWRLELDRYLSHAWSYEVDGHRVAELYRVAVP